VNAPEPDLDSVTFWAGLAHERILLQRCADCARLRFPPMGRCPYCGSAGAGIEDVVGTGAVYSWTVVHRAFDPAFAAEVPYTVVTVDLDNGPRLAVRLDGGRPTVDMRVVPRFVHHDTWTELRMVPRA
jgi:uncharacterized OB-fold protein